MNDRERTLRGLKDCGCAESQYEEYLSCTSAGEKLRFLRTQRNSIMEDLRTAQKQVDCIDYLIREVKRLEEKMGRKLVAYFSASGVTKRAAERLAKEVGADLFEIRQVHPYTKEDLNWMNKESRTTLEMRDKSSRVEIAEKVPDMEQYEEVFLGFPIWWGAAPHIINSFLEQYDFSGKTISPFATSGGSGYGRSTEGLKASAPGAKWKKGRML